MKKHLLIKAGMIIISIALATTTAFANRPEKIIEYLFCQRTDVMEEFYSQKISLDEAKSLLEDVETGELLETDIDALTEYFCTDIEEINSYKITDIEISFDENNVICAIICVVWTVNEGDKKENLNVRYSIICEKASKGYKLVQLYSLY